MRDRLTETCRCGAKIDVDANHGHLLREFREAHATCRAGGRPPTDDVPVPAEGRVTGL